MTLPFSHRSPTALARSALAALLLAGCAGTAASQESTRTASASRIAILASPDAPATAVARARDTAGATVTLRRVGGALDAQATALALAGEGFDTVIGVGADARAAIAQAEVGQVGDGTRWTTVR
jgi:hypothetical protein